MCFVKCVKKSFYPGSVVFLLLTEFITNLACKAGVFCSSSNDTIIGTNALKPSWAFKLRDSSGELKHYSRGEDDELKIKEGKGKEGKIPILSPSRPSPLSCFFFCFQDRGLTAASNVMSLR